MRRIINLCLLCVVSLFLYGCASTSIPVLPRTPIPPPYNQKMTWAARSDQLYNVDTWTIHGAFSVQTSDDQVVFAHFAWQQKETDYYLEMFGPFGLNTVEMGGASDHFYMKNGKKRYTATTPEALMEEQLGWVLPVSPLYYWIRGCPAPNKPAIKKFDAYHHLVSLKQGSWTITYLAWTGVYGMDFPTQMVITHPKMRLKLSSLSWNI